MSRAVIYTRVSTDKQEANGDSLEAQERDCKADCEQHSAVVVAVESDTFTGHDSLYDRPGLQRAIALIRSGEADLLVVKRISRMVRDQADAQVLLRDVGETGGALRSVVEGMTFKNTADDKLLMGIHAFQAEKDWETIRAQAQQGLHSRVDRGRPLVSVPLFGYVDVDGERGEKYRTKAVRVEDPEAAPTVKEIFAKAVEGWSIRRIAQYLTDQKFTTPSQLMASRGQLGNRTLQTSWTQSMVRNILWNESYTGRHAAYRNKAVRVKKAGAKTEYRMVKRAPEEAISITIPALIDDATFAIVQRNIGQRSILITDEPLLNQGIAICGVCGTKMIAARLKGPQSYRVYRCRRRRGEDKCPGGFFVVRAEEADRGVWEKMKEIIRDETRFQRLVQGKSAKLEQEHQEAARRAENLQAELSEWQANQATVFANMSKETDDTIRGMYKAELLKINETVAGLEKRSKAAQESLHSTQHTKDVHRILLQGIAAMMRRYDTWKSLTERYLIENGGNPDDADTLIAMVREAAKGTSLDTLDRAEKRRIMQAIDVWVKMYPRGYVDADGVAHDRCEISFTNGSTDISSGRYNARTESVPIGMVHRGSPTSLEYIWRYSMGDKSPKNKEKRKPKKAKAVAK
jgi:site-specific DNA recombinase